MAGKKYPRVLLFTSINLLFSKTVTAISDFVASHGLGNVPKVYWTVVCIDTQCCCWLLNRLKRLLAAHVEFDIFQRTYRPSALDKTATLYCLLCTTCTNNIIIIIIDTTLLCSRVSSSRERGTRHDDRYYK